MGRVLSRRECVWRLRELLLNHLRVTLLLSCVHLAWSTLRLWLLLLLRKELTMGLRWQVLSRWTT